MGITVSVMSVFGDGNQTMVNLNDGATAADAGRAVSAPPNAKYKVNGVDATPNTQLSNGDSVVITSVKYDAGC